MMDCLNFAFCIKLRYFTDPNGPKRGPHENEFLLVSDTKMNIPNRAEKVDEEMGSFV